MQQKAYIKRRLENEVSRAIQNFPVTAIIGPRQCGKSTMIKHLARNHSPELLYLDLERPSDLEKLRDAEWFLSQQKDKLICIDEIQRRPELFPLIRSLVDEWDRPGCFVVLGSASRDLLAQSSESLAGRIVYKQLTPFLWSEIESSGNLKMTMPQYMVRGGFPRSVLNNDDKDSLEWRDSFIVTFLERDLLQWQNFTPQTMGRLWKMLAHVNGQTVNYSMLGNSLSVSSQTIKNYIDLLASTYMVQAIPPYISNVGKRLVKSPKVYLSDTGIIAALLQLGSFNDLMGHPVFGSVWESLVLSNLMGHFPDSELFFYRTSNGAEIDFVLKKGNRHFAIECKASSSPVLSKGNFIALEDIQPDYTFVVIPDTGGWPMKEKMAVVSLNKLIDGIKNFKK